MLRNRSLKRAETWGLDRAKVLSDVDGIWGYTGLSQRAPRGSGYGREAGIIDLGHEPPLSVDGSEAAVIDRRRVSVQGLGGLSLPVCAGRPLFGAPVSRRSDAKRPFPRVRA